MTKEEILKDIRAIDDKDNPLLRCDNDDKAMLYIVEKTAERVKREMIEKAAEWLYIYYPTLERSKSFEDAWKHFKQAMEEEK